MALEICQHQLDDKAIIWNLFQFYCYDTSVYDGYDVEETGFYQMSEEYFSQYWTIPTWRAHLLRWNGSIAGFALLEDSDAVAGGMEIADLFVMQRFRRLGIASQVAEHFMARRSKPWTVTIFDDAADAKKFWIRLFSVAAFTPEQEVSDPDGRAAKVFILPANTML